MRVIAMSVAAVRVSTPVLTKIRSRCFFTVIGIGECFELRAEVMRLGSRVASTRMEFLGVDGKLLSTGSAAYIVVTLIFV
jgi:acyl-coenzyme A thioesterase PaaI-like protein